MLIAFFFFVLSLSYFVIRVISHKVSWEVSPPLLCNQILGA